MNEETSSLHQRMLSDAEKLAMIGIFEWDIPENRVSWSDGLYLIYGLSPQEFGASFEAFLDRIHPDSREKVQQTIQQAVEQGTAFEMEEQIMRSDGKIRELLSRGEVLKDEQGRPIRLVGVCQDVTDRKQAEKTRLRNARLQTQNQELESLLQELQATQARLIQSEKMAALGSLIAGIVHEMNTPIGVLMSASDIVDRCARNIDDINTSSADDTARLQEKLKRLLTHWQKAGGTIQSASSRLSSMVDTLKRFVHLEEAAYEETNLHEGLESTLTLLDLYLKDRIEVIRKYNDIPTVMSYPDELNQVFMNVLLNAAQAIETEGTITIETGMAEGRVYVQISDTGSGISPERLARIFDPSFSKKGERVKAGIGLFTAQNIIQKHQGELTIDSDFGNGSTVTIRLPVEKSG